MKLYEELFEGVEDSLLGVKNLVIDSLNKQWDDISSFNSIITTIKDEGYEDLIPIIEDIISDENIIIGKFQQIINILTPETEIEVEQGQESAQETIEDTTSELTEGISKDVDNDIYGWLHKNYGGTDWKNEFKSYIDNLSKSGYKDIDLKRDLSIAIKKFSKEARVKPQLFMSVLNESLRNSDNINRNQKLSKLESTSESLVEDVSDSSIYYVSYYEETPVSEKGKISTKCNLILSEEFTDLNDAKERIKELGEEDNMERISDEFYLDRSRYIGQDRFYIIETEKGSEEYTDEEI